MKPELSRVKEIAMDSGFRRVPVYEEKLADLMKVPYGFAPAHMNRQRAASVAALGKEKFEQGIFEDAADHAPEYLRLSQAERERQEKA